MTWMEKNGFFDPTRLGFSRDKIFFAGTRAEKIAQISALGCDVFIDDLEVNVAAAEVVGMTAVLHTEPAVTLAWLRDILGLPLTG